MRSEQEMLTLILDTARSDERIRAVIMNGSRTNPNAAHDIFQDYDIVYIVSDMAPFVRNRAWSTVGEMMILQLPDDAGAAAHRRELRVSHAICRRQPHRPDHLPPGKARRNGPDSLSVLLLDKDGLHPLTRRVSAAICRSRPAKQFDDCCNEFWWVSTYVAKGLWREEIIYARYMMDHVVREELMKMLAWYFGVKTEFAQSPGKLGKNFPGILSLRCGTCYSTPMPTPAASIRGTPYPQCVIFSGKQALPVAEHFGFTYSHGDDQRVSVHLARTTAAQVSARFWAVTAAYTPDDIYA